MSSDQTIHSSTKILTSCASQVDQSGAAMETQGPVDRYTYIDEEYLNCQQTHMSWNRDNGIIELMPIAVVYQGNSDIF